MNKNVKTYEAKLDLIEKFLDYANCADASYAMLHWINYVKKDEIDKNENGDKQTQGHKFNNQNSTYARAIEARFQKDKIIDKSLCVPYTNTCLNNETINNDITKIKLDDELIQRAINFINRFKMLYHQPNTDSGFSATLFEDTQDSSQKILAIRGTEISNDIKNDALDADMDLITGKVPNNQYLDMLLFYQSCIKQGYITQSTPLIITGHSLGGALAQLFTLSLATAKSTNNIKEVYTFNSPGAKKLRIIDLGEIYKVDFEILNAKDKARAMYKKIREYEYKDNPLRDVMLVKYESGLL